MNLLTNTFTNLKHMDFEYSLRREVFDRAHDGRLTRDDVTYLIEEHGLTYNQVAHAIGDSLHEADVILGYLGYLSVSSTL